MWRRIQPYALAALLVLAVVAYFANRNQVPGMAGVAAADGKFTPLSVQEPHLRLDLLDKLKHTDYSGSHRDIFNYGPPPVLPGSLTPGGSGAGAALRPPVGPPVPLPPPPVTVPAELFGFAVTRATGRRVAFFKQGEEVLVVAEGETFLNNFRLLRIGNDSADVEQVSDHRRATVPMLQPAAADQGNPQ
jgi:hypothetical protein